MSRASQAPIERFEQVVVFRVARGYFLALAGAAVLAVVGGLIVLAVGALRRPPAAPPEPPAVEPASALTLDGVRQWSAAQKAAEESEEKVAAARLAARSANADDQAEQSARDAEVDELLGKLQELMPEPTYSWKDVHETFCRTSTPYGCVETGRRLAKRGVLGHLVEALERLPNEDVLPALRTLATLLAEVPLEERGKMFGPIISALAESRAAHRERAAERERAMAEARDKWQAEVAEVETSKAAQLAFGGYGAIGGLALLVCVSLFLAHFAIERHLRLLQQPVEAARRPQPADAPLGEPRETSLRAAAE